MSWRSSEVSRAVGNTLILATVAIIIYLSVRWAHRILSRVG